MTKIEKTKPIIFSKRDIILKTEEYLFIECRMEEYSYSNNKIANV